MGTLNEYKEYEEVIEAILKGTGNYDIFRRFDEKIKLNRNPTQIQQNVIILTNLAAAIKDDQFKNLLYQKIIEELVLITFNVGNVNDTVEIS